VKISVVVCTRNRAVQLGEFLASARGLVVPAGLDWELIVVDNGSKDRTAEVAMSFAPGLPIRCVREEEPGLSNARNKGVAEAKGDYICWTDDDVVLDPQWLAAYAEAFQAHPEAAIFGARIIPVLLPPTPAWFAGMVDQWPITTVLAKRDFGDQPMPLDADHLPWGANYALRTREQRRHLYNPGLGVSPTHRRVGEETDVIRRILAEGGEAWWVPGSKVGHITQPGRQSARYIYEYYLSCGDTWAFLQRTQPDRNYMGDNVSEDRMLFGAPLSISKRIIRYGAAFLVTRALKSPQAWLPNLRWLGFYVGALRHWRSP
jgi:glycosyltransferase involved in cell wall biosynthesis